MEPRKILCIVGTRPEVIKMAPLVLALQQKADRFATRVVTTAQHREMLDQMLAVFGIEPDVDMDLMRADQPLADLTARVLEAMDVLLQDECPDLVIAQGDTTTAMAVSMACFYRRIPFCHVEAGLRSADVQAPYPEEFNRRVVSLTARIHFAPTGGAEANLLSEGVDSGTVFVVGNPVIDALTWVLGHHPCPELPFPEDVPFILMTCHRRESFGGGMRRIFSAVARVAERHPEIHVWYPVHPNPNVSQVAREVLEGVPNVRLSEPLDYVTFAHAMKRAKLLISDSGGVQEEASFLGKPVLVLRDVTERPEAVEQGTCLLVGTQRDRIEQELERILTDREAYAGLARPSRVFGDGHSGEEIVRVLEGLAGEGWF